MDTKGKYFHCIVLCFVIYCLRNILLSTLYIGVYYSNVTPYLITIILGLFYLFILFYAFKKNTKLPSIKPYLLVIFIISDFTTSFLSSEAFSEINTPKYLYVYTANKVIDRIFVILFAITAFYHYHRTEKNVEN